MICWMAGEKGRQGMERVTQQAGEEENPYFSKVEVATRAVLWSELGFQEISWKRRVLPKLPGSGLQNIQDFWWPQELCAGSQGHSSLNLCLGCSLPLVPMGQQCNAEPSELFSLFPVARKKKEI